MPMTREDIITYGKKKYGDPFVAAMAADMKYSVSGLSRGVSGASEVSPRMELAMEKLIRKHRFETLSKPDVRYE